MMYANCLGWSKAQFINTGGQGFGEHCLEKEDSILRMNKSNNNITACTSKLHSPRVLRTHTTKGLRRLRTEGFVTRLSELLSQMFAIIFSGIVNIVLVENKLLGNTHGKDDDKKANLFPHVNEIAPSSEWLEGNWK